MTEHRKEQLWSLAFMTAMVALAFALFLAAGLGLGLGWEYAATLMG